jgi:uncharacterized protein (DUF849 family)
MKADDPSFGPLLVNFTPTGMVPTTDMTPYVPVTTRQIVDQTLEAAELGISMVHLHARGFDEKPDWRKEGFAPIIAGIRAHRPDLVICVTTSGRDFPEIEKRADVLDLDGPLKPDMASLTLGSLNFARSASMNSPQMIQGLASRMLERGIKPELEVFDLGMVNYAHYLHRKGLIAPPFYFNLLFGNIATAQADLGSIAQMIAELPEDSVYALAGIGNRQGMCNHLAVVTGAHVRTGLEDNIYYDAGRRTLATNEMLVRRVVDVADAIGRPLATPAEVRRMLGLQPVDRITMRPAARAAASA